MQHVFFLQLGHLLEFYGTATTYARSLRMSSLRRTKRNTNAPQPLSVEEINRSSFLCRPSAAEDGYQAGGGGRPCVGVHLLASLVVSAGGLALQGQ